VVSAAFSLGYSKAYQSPITGIQTPAFPRIPSANADAIFSFTKDENIFYR
jgi:hypothetical protein